MDLSAGAIVRPVPVLTVSLIGGLWFLTIDIDGRSYAATGNDLIEVGWALARKAGVR